MGEQLLQKITARPKTQPFGRARGLGKRDWGKGEPSLLGKVLAGRLERGKCLILCRHDRQKDQ